MLLLLLFLGWILRYYDHWFFSLAWFHQGCLRWLCFLWALYHNYWGWVLNLDFRLLLWTWDLLRAWNRL